jgi:hypothetical protein
MPWLPITTQPVRKDEKTRKSRAPDQSLASFGIGPRHVPAVRHEQADKDPPGENIDIVV